MPISQKDADDRLKGLVADVEVVDQQCVEFFRQKLGVDLGRSAKYASRQQLQQIGRGYRTLDLIRRPLFLNAVQGTLGKPLKSALMNVDALPYQSGPERTPFLAPSMPELSDAARGAVLVTACWMARQANQPTSFFAEWAGYLPKPYFERGWMILAGAIDAGDNAAYTVLLETIRGTHPTAVVGHDTIRALLACNRREAWEEVGKLLLAAQRQEGLRQTILEAVDALHPEAFRFFMRLILEHDLLRFSSVVRAVCVWFRGVWDEGDAKSGTKILARVLELLNDETLKPAADPTDVYLRLWAFAFSDIRRVLAPAETYFAAGDPAVRRAVVRLLQEVGVTIVFPLLKVALEDSDPTVATIAVEAFERYADETFAKSFGSPEPLWRVASTWPTEKLADVAPRSEVWDLILKTLPADSYAQLIPSVHEFSREGRSKIAHKLGSVEPPEAKRQLALILFGDASPDVRKQAVSGLEKVPLQPAEAPVIEELLRRKPADLRQTALKLLRGQAPGETFASAERLLESADKLQRQAGLELLAELSETGHEGARARMTAFAAASPVLDEVEKKLVGRLDAPADADAKRSRFRREGFGLYTLDDLTFAPRPEPTGAVLATPAAIAYLKSLDEFIHQNRDVEATFPEWTFGDQESKELVTKTLGDDRVWLPRPRAGISYKDDKARFPFADLFEKWIATQRIDAVDPDGQEFVRAHIIGQIFDRVAPKAKHPWGTEFCKQLRYPGVIREITPWFLSQRRSQVDLNALLALLAQRVVDIDDGVYEYEELAAVLSHEESWRFDAFLEAIARMLEANAIERESDPALVAKLCKLLRYVDEPGGRDDHAAVLQHEEDAARRSESAPPVRSRVLGQKRIIRLKTPGRKIISLLLIDRALNLNIFTAADVMDALSHIGSYSYQRYSNLRTATQAGGHTPAFREVVDQYVARLVEVETSRTELPTDASELLQRVRSGIYLTQVRQLLSSNVPLLARADGTSRSAIATQAIAVSRPRPEETPEVCAAAFREDKIKVDRLIELALLAPQWAAAAELACGWKGLAEAAWWIHAHTKDDNWGLEAEIKAAWAGAISERTHLTAESLTNGAVDVPWFRRMRAQLDDKQWRKIESLAKLTSQGSGHVRAKLFAQAMVGEITIREILARITEKRTPDAVRALGLIPLGPPLDGDPYAEIRERYAVLQEFLVTSRQYGSLRQATEKMAVTIGLENLAYTAGYPDALRLTWALEASEVEDLAGNGKTVSTGEHEVRLFFDGSGNAQLEASKGGKALKEVPAAVKKLPEVKELVDRKRSLVKQGQRMRIALEQAMQRGDAFTAAELEKLFQHPGLAPMLRNLVFIGASGGAGFLDRHGRLDGEATTLAIAHPYDLLARGDWAEWQHTAFKQERVQPFKQLFRELYTLTTTEASGTTSTRYAGHQLQPRQALAILSKREWLIRPEEGVSKTLHSLGLTAHLSFEENFYTPADIEGLTLEGLTFTKSGTFESVRLSEVPPKAFSETMRDLDLIVSVASMTGIDPEASESTVEMGASVVRELVLLTELGNVRLTPNHAVVAGKLGEYTVHLGSGVVHQRTRGELVIIAVRQPQRGRLFLPFVDDDPRTAEIASKVLLLARDHEMKDPTILSQIVG